MPAKVVAKKSTAVKRPSKKPMPTVTMSRSTASDSLALSKAIAAFNTKSGAFVKAAESVTEAFSEIKNFGADRVTEYEEQISAKRKEFDIVSQDLEHQSKKRRLDSDLQFEKNEYEAAGAVLKKRTEVPISEVELASLKTAVAASESTHKVELDKAITDAKRAELAAVKAATTNQGLVHKAEIAEISAASKQKEAEVATLKQQILQQQKEIAEQRALTKSVAEAGRQGAISQSFGKQ